MSPDPIACWACGTPSLVPSTRLSPLPFLECPVCGFQQHTGVNAAAHYVADAYGKDHAAEYTASEPDRAHDARQRIKFLNTKVRSGSLLDVGTAGGTFVAVAGDAGFDARGLEPTPSFAKYAQDRGRNVQASTLEEADIPPGSLDVVTLWHVLEHLEHPVEPLGLIRRALKPGGRFFLEIPNAGSKIAREMGTQWPLLQPTVHVGQYTSSSLRALLKRAGFAVELVEARSILPYARLKDRYVPGALMHRFKWRGGEAELLVAVASPA